jgi:hypothetical protein
MDFLHENIQATDLIHYSVIKNVSFDFVDPKRIVSPIANNPIHMQ